MTAPHFDSVYARTFVYQLRISLGRRWNSYYRNVRKAGCCGGGGAAASSSSALPSVVFCGPFCCRQMSKVSALQYSSQFCCR